MTREPQGLMAPGYMHKREMLILFVGGIAGNILLLFFIAASWTASVVSSGNEKLDAARSRLLEATTERMAAQEAFAAASLKLRDLRAAPDQPDANLVADAEEQAGAAEATLEAAREQEQQVFHTFRQSEAESAQARPSEQSVLSMVMMMGALGGFLHFVSSLSVYLGNRQLEQSWLYHYLLLPVRGAGLAVVVYLLARVGIVTPGANEAGQPDLNFPVIYAMAALTGMFAKSATEKLAEVFKTLFRTATPPPPSSESPIRRRIPMP